MILNLAGFWSLQVYEKISYEGISNVQNSNETIIECYPSENDKFNINMRYYFGFLNGISMIPGIQKQNRLISLLFSVLLWVFQEGGLLSYLLLASFIFQAIVFYYLATKQEDYQLQDLKITENSMKTEEDSKAQEKQNMKEELQQLRDQVKSLLPVNMVIISNEMNVIYTTDYFRSVARADSDQDVLKFFEKATKTSCGSILHFLQSKLKEWNTVNRKENQVYKLPTCQIELEVYNIIVIEGKFNNCKCIGVIVNSLDDISTFNQYTQKMINSISHDLKTPLNAIILLLDLLKDSIKNKFHQFSLQKNRISMKNVPNQLSRNSIGRRSSVLWESRESLSEFILPSYYYSDSFSQEKEEMSKFKESFKSEHQVMSTFSSIKQHEQIQIPSKFLDPLQEVDEYDHSKNKNCSSTEEWFRRSSNLAASRNHLYHENYNIEEKLSTQGTTSVLNPSPSYRGNQNFNQQQPFNNLEQQPIILIGPLKEEANLNITNSEFQIIQTENLAIPTGQHLLTISESPQSQKKVFSLFSPGSSKSPNSKIKHIDSSKQHGNEQQLWNHLNINLQYSKISLIVPDSHIDLKDDEIIEHKKLSNFNNNLSNNLPQIIISKHVPNSRTPSRHSVYKNIHQQRNSLKGSLLFRKDSLKSFQDKKETQELFSYLTNIQTNSYLLESRINDLIDYSTLLSKKNLSQSCTQFNLMEVLLEMRDLFKIQAENKNITLVFPNIDIKIKNDKPRIKQILHNLLSNAVKFTFEGYVRIRIAASNDNPNLLQIIIEDTGIGIPNNILRNLISFTDHIKQVKDDHKQGMISVFFNHYLFEVLCQEQEQDQKYARACVKQQAHKPNNLEFNLS